MKELLDLSRQAREFLKEHDELVAVTIRRRVEPPKPRYKNARSENYKLMPDTCPIVRNFIEDLLPLGETVTQAMRDAIFEAHQSLISNPWREHFGNVLGQKHRAINELKYMRRTITDLLDEIEGIDYEELNKKGEDAAIRTLAVDVDEDEG